MNADVMNRARRLTTRDEGKVTRLLILSCSAGKRPESGLLPAVERYDSPAFRVVRRFIRRQRGDELDIAILSARFGVLAAADAIPYYDQRLTPGQAEALKPAVSAAIEQWVLERRPVEMFVHGSEPYQRLLEPVLTWAAAHAGIRLARGSPGRKLSELHAWLYGRSLVDDERLPVRPAARARVRGVDVTMQPDEVYNVARRALAEQRGDPTRFHSWFVDVDGIPVGSKWLVTQISGLSPDRFVTSEACRLLSRLGIPVQRQ